MRKLVSCLIIYISIHSTSSGTINLPTPLGAEFHPPLQLSQSIYLPHLHYIRLPPPPQPVSPIQGCFFYMCPTTTTSSPLSIYNQWLSNRKIAPVAAPIPIQCVYRSLLPGPPGPSRVLGPLGPSGLQGPSNSGGSSSTHPPDSISTRTTDNNADSDVIKSEVTTSKTTTVTSSPLSGSSPVERTTDVYTLTTFDIDLLGESDLQNDIKKESRTFLGINF